jgi:hypothetical protein
VRRLKIGRLSQTLSLLLENCAVVFPLVITGLDPVIHLLSRERKMDGRVKPGHDDKVMSGDHAHDV